MTRNTPYKVKYAYITAIWVEMVSPTFFTSPANVPIYTLALGQDSEVQSISVFNGNDKIGSSSTGILFYELNIIITIIKLLLNLY